MQRPDKILEEPMKLAVGHVMFLLLRHRFVEIQQHARDD